MDSFLSSNVKTLRGIVPGAPPPKQKSHGGITCSPVVVVLHNLARFPNEFAKFVSELFCTLLFSQRNNGTT